MSNFEHSTSEQELTPTTNISTSAAGNTPSEDELLSRAKDALDAGERSMRDAAEALGIAHELHGTSQAEMARAIGKSEAWVSQLLRWRRSGYEQESPFGPTTKAGRLKHAKDRLASGTGKPRKPRNGSEESQTDAEGPKTSSWGPKTKDKVEIAASPPEPQENTPDEQTSSSPSPAAPSPVRKPSPDQAKGNLRYAIDHWWPLLDDADRKSTRLNSSHTQKSRMPSSA